MVRLFLYEKLFPFFKRGYGEAEGILLIKSPQKLFLNQKRNFLNFISLSYFRRGVGVRFYFFWELEKMSEEQGDLSPKEKPPLLNKEGSFYLVFSFSLLRRRCLKGGWGSMHKDHPQKKLQKNLQNFLQSNKINKDKSLSDLSTLYLLPITMKKFWKFSTDSPTAWRKLEDSG